MQSSRITRIRLILSVAVACLLTHTCSYSAEISPDEARAIAREAVIYGFPIVEGYKTLYKQSVDKKSSDYSASNKGHRTNGELVP